MRTRRSLCMLLLCASVALPSQSVGGSHQADAVNLQGRLLRVEFFGPPNYGESPSADRREWVLVLQLPASPETQAVSCNKVAAAELCSELNATAFVQLMLPPLDSKKYKSLLGKKVQVTGVPFLSETGHHRTKVLLQAQAIRGIQAWSWSTK